MVRVLDVSASSFGTQSVWLFQHVLGRALLLLSPSITFAILHNLSSRFFAVSSIIIFGVYLSFTPKLVCSRKFFSAAKVRLVVVVLVKCTPSVAAVAIVICILVVAGDEVGSITEKHTRGC